MEAEMFLIVSAATAIAIFASIPRFPGAMIGFFFGVTVAFFIAPVAFAAASLLRRLGIGINPKIVGFGLLGVWCTVAVYRAFRAGMAWHDGIPDDARYLAAQAMLMLALPAIGFFSSRALTRAWP